MRRRDGKVAATPILRYLWRATSPELQLPTQNKVKTDVRRQNKFVTAAATEGSTPECLLRASTSPEGQFRHTSRTQDILRKGTAIGTFVLLILCPVRGSSRNPNHEKKTKKNTPTTKHANTHQQHSDNLIGQLVVDLLPQENNTLAVEAVVDVHPVRARRPRYSVCHLPRTFEKHEQNQKNIWHEWFDPWAGGLNGRAVAGLELAQHNGPDGYNPRPPPVRLPR